MPWLLVPIVLAAGAVALLRAIRLLDEARRDLARAIASLAEARAGIGPARAGVDATLAAIAEREHR